MYNDKEIEQLKRMRNTDGWGIVVAECERRMASIKDSLILNTETGIEEIRKLQGEYKALKEFLNKFNIN